MSGVNDNAPHLQSQVVPPGNHTGNAQPLDKQLLALQARERELTKREQALKNSVSLDSLKERVGKGDFGFLKDIGVPEHMIPKQEPQGLEKDFRELQAQLAAERREREEKAYFDELRGKLQSDEKFQLVNQLGQHDVLFDHLRSTRQPTGEWGDYASVAEELENNLLSSIQKALEAPKVRDLISKIAPNQSSNNQAKPHPLDSRNTLNTQDRSQTTPVSQERRLSHMEQIQEAAKHLKFTTPEGK